MREKLLGSERETTAVERSSLCFQVLLLVLILSLRKLQGFLLYGFPEENYLCLLSLVFIAVHVILSVKDHNARLNYKNLTGSSQSTFEHGTCLHFHFQTVGYLACPQVDPIL